MVGIDAKLVMEVVGEIETFRGLRLGASTIRECGVAYRSVGKKIVLASILGLDKCDKNFDYGEMLPKTMCGLPVVIEREGSDMAVASWGSRRPRPGGALAADGSARYGTLGCFVTKSQETFGLTCEHVLARTDLMVEIGTRIRYRKPPIQGEKSVDFGIVSEIGNIDYANGIAEVDSAIIKTEQKTRFTPLGMKRFSRQVFDPYLAVATKAMVIKTGCQRRSLGRVNGIKDITVLDRFAGGAQVRILHKLMLEVIVAEDEDRNIYFNEPGDSGAVLWTVDSPHRPVGILCATSDGWKGYAMPLERVLEAHRVEMA